MTTTHAAALAAIESALEVEAAATPLPDPVANQTCSCGPTAPYDSHDWDCPQHPQNWPPPAVDRLARALLRPALEGAREALERHRPIACDWPECEPDCYQCIHCAVDHPCPDATAALALADACAHVSEGGAK